MKRSWLLTALAAAILLAAFVLVGRAVDADIVDDAYIFLRYARNCVSGHGPVFNPGERVEGYTSPLWLTIMCAAALMGADLPAAAVLLGAILGGAVALMAWAFTYRIVGARNAALALVVPAALVTNLAFQFWAWSGMETVLFTACLFLTFMLFVSALSKDASLVPAGCAFALAIFARPDAAATLPVWLAFAVFEKRRTRHAVRGLIEFLAPLLSVGIHLVWRRIYYGVWLPNTYYAKAGIPEWVLWRSGIAYTTEFLESSIALMAPLLLFALLHRWFGGRIRMEVRVAAAMAAVWIAYVTFIGGDHFGMYRFYVPLMPFAAVCLAVEAADCLQSMHVSALLRNAVVPVLLVLAALLHDLEADRRDAGRGYAAVAMTRQWVKVGLWARGEVPAGGSIATLVIGAIPYYSGLRTWDMLGLTDVHIARHGNIYARAAVGHQKFDTAYILARRPDLIILPMSGLDDKPFPAVYDTVHFFAAYMFVRDPRTAALYDYHASPLDDGTYVQYFRLRSSGVRPRPGE